VRWADAALELEILDQGRGRTARGTTPRPDAGSPGCDSGDESFFVGEHDCLDAVAQVELCRYPADVGRDGALAQARPIGELSRRDRSSPSATRPTGQVIVRFITLTGSVRPLCSAFDRNRVV
jgi:hypothetical protein